jgi:hypothetical protein
VFFFVRNWPCLPCLQQSTNVFIKKCNIVFKFHDILPRGAEWAGAAEHLQKMAASTWVLAAILRAIKKNVRLFGPILHFTTFLKYS